MDNRVKILSSILRNLSTLIHCSKAFMYWNPRTLKIFTTTSNPNSHNNSEQMSWSESTTDLKPWTNASTASNGSLNSCTCMTLRMRNWRLTWTTHSTSLSSVDPSSLLRVRSTWLVVCSSPTIFKLHSSMSRASMSSSVRVTCRCPELTTLSCIWEATSMQ